MTLPIPRGWHVTNAGGQYIARNAHGAAVSAPTLAILLDRIGAHTA